jgi:hypothetical protein
MPGYPGGKHKVLYAKKDVGGYLKEAHEVEER